MSASLRSGLFLASFSALSISLGPNLAKLAYLDGSNTLTVTVFRGVCMIFLTFCYLKARGSSLRIERRPLRICLATGAIFAVMSYGFLGAVNYIPVGLALLVYFTHPIVVMVTSHFFLGVRMKPQRLVCALVILLGLGVTLGINFNALDLRGIGLALLASLSCAAMILGNARAMEDASAIIVNFYMVCFTTILLSVTVVLNGALAIPETLTGWGYIVGVGVCFTLGLLSFFAAFPKIGAVKATMITSSQPLFGILFAYILFSEKLTLLQGIGATAVILGLVAMDLPIGGMITFRTARGKGR